MHVGHAECADATHELGVEGRAVNFQSAQRIGSVEQDHFNVVFKTRLHRVTHDDVKRVGAHADVLQVDHERIDVAQLCFGRFAVFAVQRIHRQSAASVDNVGHIFTRSLKAVESVFRGKKRDELGVGRAAEHIDGALAVAVDAGRMGQQADLLPGDGVKFCQLEHVDAEHHRGERAS